MQNTLRIPIGPRTATVAVLACFTWSRLVPISVPSEREYDEGVYLLSARALASGHALFTSVFSSQPPAFLETLALAFRVGGDSLESGRALSMAFAVVALAAVASLGRSLAAGGGDRTAPADASGVQGGRGAARWAGASSAAALALTGTFRDLAHFVQAETPALALALVALVVALAARRRNWQGGLLALSGALFALACLFKLIVLPLAAPLGLLLVLAPGDGPWAADGTRRGGGLLARIAARSAWVASGAAAVALLPLVLYDAGALWHQTVSFHVAKHAVYDVHPLANLLRLANVVTDDWGIALSAALGLALMARRLPLAAAWIAAWLVAVAAALAFQSPLFWRHFVLAWPPLALAAGVATSLVAPRRAMAVALAATALWATSSLPSRVARNTQPEGERRTGAAPAKSNPLDATVRWIGEHSEPGDLVAGDDPIAIYLAARQSPPELCDTSQARILSGWLPYAEATGKSATARVLVLRSDGRLSKLEGYERWVETYYDRQDVSGTSVGTTRSVWIRKRTAGTAGR